VGIFSLFGKKERQAADTSAENSSLRKKRETPATRPAPPASPAPSKASLEAKNHDQRKVAQATAKKIDAIESEMTGEFAKPSLVNAARAVKASKPAPADSPPGAMRRPATPETDSPPTLAPLLSVTKGTTEMLLSSETMYAVPAAISISEAPPVIEEAAILYANDQTDMVENVLRAAIEEDALGLAAMAVWLMLFDLYQITGNRTQFDHVSIEYASKFETSPPSWIEAVRAPAAAAAGTGSSAIPGVAFSGALDAGVVKQLEKAQNLAEHSRVLRLEFARITEVNPIGCGLLLNVLKKLQKSGLDLVLVGAFELTIKIRAILEVGRRDETEAPWLLLLEILQLLNRETEFEEASIDYCVTFEVSPPAFVAPRNKVTTAVDETPAAPAAVPVSDFSLPAVVAGAADVDKLLARITTYAVQHNPVVIDCLQLQRVNFSAAGQLLTGLSALAAQDIKVEFHNINHLVAALFAVMGLKDVVRVVLRKS